MMMISKEDYLKREAAYVKERMNTANPKPRGMWGTWSWHIETKKNFKKLLAEQGIEIQK